MTRISLHKAIQRLGAAIIAAFALLSCSPVEVPENPQKGYWYDIDVPASIMFECQGGSCTIVPMGYIYLDGQLLVKRPLADSEVELVFLEGNEDFLSRDGFTFITWQTQTNHRAYYRVIWRENGAMAHFSVVQFKPRI